MNVHPAMKRLPSTFSPRLTLSHLHNSTTILPPLGIDIDYEAQTAAQWENELVKTNVIGHLRAVMPASQYSIFLTVGGIAASAGTPVVRGLHWCSSRWWWWVLWLFLVVFMGRTMLAQMLLKHGHTTPYA